MLVYFSSRVHDAAVVSAAAIPWPRGPVVLAQPLSLRSPDELIEPKVSSKSPADVEAADAANGFGDQSASCVARNNPGRSETAASLTASTPAPHPAPTGRSQAPVATMLTASAVVRRPHRIKLKLEAANAVTSGDIVTIDKRQAQRRRTSFCSERGKVDEIGE